MIFSRSAKLLLIAITFISTGTALLSFTTNNAAACTIFGDYIPPIGDSKQIVLNTTPSPLPTNNTTDCPTGSPLPSPSPTVSVPPKASTPIPTPTPTVTPTPVTNTGTLKVTTLLKGTTDLPVSNVAVFDTTTGSAVNLGPTDENGILKATGLPVGAHQISIGSKGDMAKDAKTVTIQANQEASLTFGVEEAQDNAIGGTIKTSSNQPSAGTTIRVKNKNGDVVALDVTDDQGTYRVLGLPAGEYSVETANPSAFDGPAQSTLTPKVTFTSDRGSLARRDGKVNPAASSTKVTIRVFESKNGLPMPPELKVKFSLFGGTATSAQVRPLDSRESPATYTLKAGCYVATATASGYITGPASFCVHGDNKAYEVAIRLQKLERAQGDCLKKPQPNINEFWFCGATAKALANDSRYAPTFSNVGLLYGNLRSLYGIGNAPLQVFIESTNVRKSQFLGKLGQPGTCPYAPTGKTDPKLAERVVFSSLAIQEHAAVSTDKVKDLAIHEWAHSKDWRLGQCQAFSSELNNRFNRAYRLMASRYPTELSALNESTYSHLPYGYNPVPNEKEAYAAAFHIWALYPNEFSQRISGYSPEAQKLLKLMVIDATAKTAPPQ